MEYNVEELSPVERKVQVTVPAEEVNAALIATTALYSRGVEIKGFRKGKVPQSVVEQRYRKQITGEATTDLINLHINEILGELKITPVSGLNVDAGELNKGEDFVYSLSFEVAPPLDLPLYRGLEVEEEAVVVDEDEVSMVVDRVRENMAELVDVEEKRKAQDGDIAVISFAALGDKAFEGVRANNFQLTLGEGQALPEFEEVVKTLEPGQNGTKEISFPEDFINEAIAGKTAEMRVHLESLKKKILPEVDDELAKKSGFENLEKMREAITASYTQSRKQLNKSNAQKKLLEQLLEGMEIPLPPSQVEKNIDFMVGDLRERLERQGKSLESLGKKPEELREQYRAEAEDMARNQVFLLAVAAKENLTVQPQEVDAVIQDVARKTGQDFEQLKRYHEDTGITVSIKDRLLTDKAMELIYENAKVTEVEPKPAEEAGPEEAGKE